MNQAAVLVFTIVVLLIRVPIKNSGGGILIADALHIFSAERYNDGKAVRQLPLEPMDGIILRWIKTSGP